MPADRQPARVLCLGEALVDLVGQDRGRSLPRARHVAPHLGGVVANIAVYAARSGAEVALAGGAGDDVWGRWLRERLVDEGVEVSLFRLAPGRQTPLALVSVDEAGEPAYELRSDGAPVVAPALGDRLEQEVADSAALLISSNTLSDPVDREATMRARAAALELGRPVIFDANLRLHRWGSRADAAASANACVPGALLVRANLAEAEVMTGESEGERAALALVKAGARLVLLSIGRGGVILRGAVRAQGAMVEPRVVRNSAGAGDALTGVLLARLALSGYYPTAVAAALPEALAAAARACELWGAVD